MTKKPDCVDLDEHHQYSGTQQQNGQQQQRHMKGAVIQLLDGKKIQLFVHKNAEGKALFDQAIDYLNLDEKDYFALSFRDSASNRNWLYNDKRIKKQLKGRSWDFQFEVKFYPPDPSTLSEDLTRYFIYHQVRRDVYTEKLPVSFATQALLGSYVAQSEFSDFDEQLDLKAYNKFFASEQLTPNANGDLIEKITELHRTHKGQTSADAELQYLDTARKLTMYGVDLHPAKDSKGVTVLLGVSSQGLMVYRDNIRINRFPWSKIVKIAYRRHLFSIKLRPEELKKNETNFVFRLIDYYRAKKLWKTAVEHHTFFRLMQPEIHGKKRLFRWGSAGFRYIGRTHFQSKMASQLFERPAPLFQRSQSARIVSKSDEQRSDSRCANH